MAPSARQYDMTVYPTSALVRSESDGGKSYAVTFPGCPCGDFTNRKGRLVAIDGGVIAVTLCKHVAEGLARVGGWHRVSEPEVHERLMMRAAQDVLAGAGLNPGAVRLLMDDAGESGRSEFYPGIAGAKVGGVVESDRAKARWTITLYA